MKAKADSRADTFGDRILDLRKAKGYSLRKLAPLVGVGFSYLSRVENDRLDFDRSPLESLIHRLAELEALADPDDLRRYIASCVVDTSALHQTLPPALLKEPRVQPPSHLSEAKTDG